jgi:hypothetical protein
MTEILLSVVPLMAFLAGFYLATKLNKPKKRGPYKARVIKDPALKKKAYSPNKDLNKILKGEVDGYF